MKLLSFLFVILTIFAISCGSPDNEEIEAFLSQREEAIEQKDVDTYMTLIAPDYDVEKDNKTIGREDVKKNFLSNVTLFDTLELTNANRSIYERDGVIEVVQFTVVDASVAGTSTISGGACNGRSLGLNNAKMLTSSVANDSGTAAFNVKLPADYKGKKVHLQAYAETNSTCGISNRVTQTIQTVPAPTPPPNAASVSSNPVLYGFSPNVAGESNSLTVTDAPPGSTVFVNYSLIDDTKNRFKVNEKIHLSKIDGKWYIVQESDADFLERFVFGGSN